MSIKENLQRYRHVSTNGARNLWLQFRGFIKVNGKAIDIDAGILPNFCNGWVIFNVIVIAEMLAIVISLVTGRFFTSPVTWLLYISLLVQWIALISAGVLCLSRKHINRLPKTRAMVIAYLLLLIVVWVVSEVTFLLWTEYSATSLYITREDFLIQNLFVSAIVLALALRYFVAKHELQQRTLSEAKAKMQALQSRIRPHFLFNSMNIIAGLTYNSPAEAEAAIVDIAELFRMMLNDKENLVPVHNEIDVAKKYLSLEKLRLDNRLIVEWDIGKFQRKAIMPVLTLQPLLENAIHYGIESLPGGGKIRIQLWEDADKTHISITTPAAIKRNDKSERDFNQAMETIRLRFQNHYGKDATLAHENTGGKDIISVSLPTRGDKL